MMGNPINWLAQNDMSGHIGMEQYPIADMTNGEVYVNLLFINYGSPNITGWGVHDGPFGLTQSDALLLSHIHGFVCGMLYLVSPEQANTFIAEIKNRVKTMKDNYDEGVMPNEI